MQRDKATMLDLVRAARLAIDFSRDARHWDDAYCPDVVESARVESWT